MATTTSLGLRKPEYTDSADVVADISDNMDTLDTLIDAKAPKASPTFTGTVTMAAVNASGALTALSGVFGGYAKVGEMGAATYAGFVNSSLGTPDTQFALLQGTAGNTVVNCATGQTVTLTVNNATLIATFSASGLTMADTFNIVTSTSTGSSLGAATNQKTGMHGARVVQRAGAAQAAVVTTAAQLAGFGYATQAQADAIVTLVNEIRATLVEKGIFKGAA